MNRLTRVPAWTAAFGSPPPVGYAMRQELEHRWGRFHSLPGSKRYPESHGERAELPLRHETIASHVLGKNSGCLLVFALSKRAGRFQIGRQISIDMSSSKVFMRRKFEGHVWRFAAIKVAWRNGATRNLIRLVSNGEFGPVVLANMRTARAYAPYDGGADLFLSNRAQAASFWLRHAKWQSTQPSGL